MDEGQDLDLVRLGVSHPRRRRHVREIALGGVQLTYPHGPRSRGSYEGSGLAYRQPIGRAIRGIAAHRIQPICSRRRLHHQHAPEASHAMPVQPRVLGKDARTTFVMFNNLHKCSLDIAEEAFNHISQSAARSG